MERTGSIPAFWFVAMALVCTCLNYYIDPTLVGSRSPLMFATGQSYDISPCLGLYFLVSGKQEFPSTSRELRGRWVGISEDVGNSLCYIIYNEAKCTIVNWSEVRSTLDPNFRNLREDPLSFDSGPLSDVRYVPTVPPEPGETTVLTKPGEHGPQFIRDAQSELEKKH